MGAAQLHATGRIAGRSGANPLIEIEIQATGSVQPMAAAGGMVGSARDEQLASLTTRFAAPQGHSIVLGVTPIRSANSVFVLQVLPELSSGK